MGRFDKYVPKPVVRVTGYEGMFDKYVPQQADAQQGNPQDIRNTLGYRMAQWGVDKEAQGNWVNDKIIGTVNAGAGIAKTVADLARPGGSLSRNIDGFIQGGKDVMTPERQAADALYVSNLQQAKANGEFGVGAMFEHYAHNPSILLEDVAGNALPFMLTGGMANGIGAGARTTQLAVGALGAASGAGTVRGNIYDNTQGMDDAYLQSVNPEYRALRQSQNEMQAKHQIGTQVLPNLPMIAVGAASGFATGATGLGRVVAGRGGNPVRTALSEFVGEAVDEGGQQFLGNAGTRLNVDPNYSLSNDVAINAAQGALIGGPSGVAAGIGAQLNNRRAQPKTGSTKGMFDKYVPQNPQQKAANLSQAIVQAGQVANHIQPTQTRPSIRAGVNGWSSNVSQTLAGNIQQSAQRYGVNPNLMTVMTWIESRGDANAVSPTGARGIGQFIGDTAERYGIKGKGFDNRHNEAQSIDAMARYVRDIQKSTGSTEPYIVYMGYQQGEGGASEIVRAAREGREVSAKVRANMDVNGGKGKTPAQFLDMWKTKWAQAERQVLGDGSSIATSGEQIQSIQPQDNLGDDMQSIQDAQDAMEAQTKAMREAQDSMEYAVYQQEKQSKALRGADTEVDVSGKYEPSEWQIQEADDLGATMEKADNQLRDQTRVASEQQIEDIANNLDHRKLTDSPQMDYGAPTLAQDERTVIGGNGRIAAIKRAYANGKADQYRIHLTENAGRYGFTSEQVSQFKNPVLVRRFKNDAAVPLNTQDAPTKPTADTPERGMPPSVPNASVNRVALPTMQGAHKATATPASNSSSPAIAPMPTHIANQAEKIQAAEKTRSTAAQKTEEIQSGRRVASFTGQTNGGKEGVAEHRAKQVAAELRRKQPDLIHKVVEDHTLKNGWRVDSFEPEPNREATARHERPAGAIADESGQKSEAGRGDGASTEQSGEQGLSDGGGLQFSKSSQPDNNFDAAARKYGGREAYEQAKSQGKTELNYHQWVQVRTPEFKAWFGDWENDPDNASKVVNEKTGEPLVMYHGSDKHGFTVFNDESYFTRDIDYAKNYVQKTQTSDAYQKIYSVFLNIKQPFDTNNSTEKSIFQSEFYKKYGNGAPLTDNGYPDWTDGADLLEFLDENHAEYDGLMLDEGGYGGYGNEYKWRGISYVPSNKNQIKSATDNTGAFSSQNDDIRYSRSDETKAKYEQRIDELFRGGKPNLDGVRVLDQSDMLDMFGLGNKPVHLAEGKVNTTKHSNMTAEVWKKIPDWIENPVAVFDSDTVNGRLVFVAPETIGSAPVLMIVEPNGQSRSDGISVHLLQNAYDKDQSMPPFGKWFGSGKGRFVDTKKFPIVLKASGLQLSGTAWQNKAGIKKILTEKNLAGYRKSHNQSDVSKKATDRSSVQAIQKAIHDVLMFKTNEPLERHLPLVRVVQSDSRVGSDVQAMYDPKTKAITLIADNIQQGKERGVFLHEIFHKRGRELMGERYGQLKGLIDPWENHTEGSIERQVYDAAKRRADDSGERGQRYDDELIAYAIEEAVNRGVEPKRGDLERTGVRGFVARAMQLFNQALSKAMGKPAALKAQDLVTAAYGAAGIETKQTGSVESTVEGVQFSKADKSHVITAETKTQEQLRYNVDGMNRLSNVEQQLADMGIDTGVKASDAAVAYHGRLAERINDFQKKDVGELMRLMRDAKTSNERVDWFLLARHAEERNRRIAILRPSDMQDGGSGMTTQQAKDLLNGKDVQMTVQVVDEDGAAQDQEVTVKGFSEDELKQLQSVGDWVDRQTLTARKQMIEYGLQKREQVMKWGGDYRHYVPLAGNVREGELMGAARHQTGFSVRGSGVKQALGRRSVAPNILEQVIRQREEVLQRGEKNLVARRFVVMANNAMKEESTLKMADGKPLFEINPTDTRRYLNDGVLQYDEVPAKDQNKLVTARHNGRDVVVRVNDPALIEAVRNLDAPELGQLLQFISKGTRGLSMMYTGANPQFWLKAFVRDAISTAALGQRYGRGYVSQVFKELPKALAITFSSEFRNNRSVGEENADYAAFRLSGGRTGFIQILRDLGDKRTDLENKLAALGELNRDSAVPKLKQALELGLEWVTYVGSSFESAMRYAAWRAAKAQGLNNEQAGIRAKEITVNFNRKGSGQTAKVMSASFVFYNAQLQGARQQVISLKSPRVVAALVPLTALAMLGQSLVLASLDDDDRELLRQNPAFLRDRVENLLLPTWNSERPYLKIPLPPDLFWVSGIGSSIAEGLSSTLWGGDGHAWNALTSLGSGFAKSVLPPPLSEVAAANPLENGAKTLALAAPTVLKPFSQAAFNVSYTGGDLYPNYKPNAPDSTKAWGRNKHGWASDLAVWLNRSTGGDSQRSGLIDVSPETMMNFVQAYLGGVGTFVSKGWDAIENPAKGWLDAPVVSSFVASPEALDRGNSSRVDKALREQESLRSQLRGYLKEGNVERANDVRQELQKYGATISKRQRLMMNQRINNTENPDDKLDLQRRKYDIDRATLSRLFPAETVE